MRFLPLKINDVQFECQASTPRVIGGIIKAPADPGFGAEFDPEWVKKRQAARM